MRSTVFFQTSGSLYMYDNLLQSYTISHPLIFHYYSLDQQEKLSSDFSLMNISNFPKGFNKQDKKYYFEKYFHLKQLGYFVEKEKTIFRKYSVQNIKSAFYNAAHVVFELTDSCNLRCTYCGYGDMYYNHDTRSDKFMKMDTVRCFFDFLSEYWSSEMNISSKKSITIGFYGGEPLLNFQLIKDTIEYINSRNFPNIKFKYSMTTNGTLLYKHIDFLIKHDFQILLSLDGTEYNHSYRVFPNGKNSHLKIISNIKKIMEEYPQFYNENISINAVLHDRNSVESINDFIKKELGKTPQISQLNNIGIKEDKKKEFAELYNNYFSSLKMSNKQEDLINDLFDNDLNVRILSRFIFMNNNNQFDSINNILNKRDSYNYIQTGTCIPFERKIYVTVNNKILACERINQDYVLGKIENNNVIVDFEQVAKSYDSFFDIVYKLCKNCYQSGKCSQCIFQLENIDENTKCDNFLDETQFSNMLGYNISFLENHPTLFYRLLNEVFIQ